MSEWKNTDKAVLASYPKPIAHMRRRFRDRQLSLVFGTGLTQPLGMPGWKALNQLIAAHPAVDGMQILAVPTEESVKELCESGSYKDIVKLMGSGPEETIITQRLYEHFKKQYKSAHQNEPYSLELIADIQREWRAIIREQLYGESDGAKPKNLAKSLLKKHPYLKTLMPIVRRMPLTITYNFDDILELALVGIADKADKDARDLGRAYETTTDIRIPNRKRNGVIYHPNGHIPRNTMEGGFDRIVLSEDEFADRMIETMTGQYASLSHHFQRSTCVLIGLSLKDSILKIMMSQSARTTPGHYHYFVHFCKDGKKPSQDEQDAICAANFETFHLITLFLSNSEIASLGALITNGYDVKKDKVDDSEFIYLTEEVGVEPVYHYYIVGAVGAGKSTLVSHVRDLVTHDEWVEDRLPELAETWRVLDQDEENRVKKEKVDKWIAEQFSQKNHILLKEKVGLVVSDRCPLDPLAFTDKPNWPEKARYLLSKIAPGQSTTKIQEGQIIYIENDPRALELRIRHTNKKYRREELKEMQNYLDIIYFLNGDIKVRTQLMSLVDVITRVAHIIHMEPYSPVQLHDRLTAIGKGQGTTPLFDIVEK